MRDACASRKPVWDDEYAFESLSAGEVQAPRGVSDVWQALSLETHVFGSVAMLGFKGDFEDVWQVKDLGVWGIGNRDQEWNGIGGPAKLCGGNHVGG